MRIGRRALLGAAGIGVLAACGSSPPGNHGLPRPTRHAYGSDTSQYALLHRPVGTPHGVVVVLHGGFWSDQYGLDLNEPISTDLARRGWIAYNVEYRRLGDGGGWPQTGRDVFAAIDHLAALLPHRPGPVIAIGHSAGGQLAGVSAARAHGAVLLDAAISQAGVVDLVYAAQTDVGGGAVEQYLDGTPHSRPAAYAAASPYALLPIRVPVSCVHSPDDREVPFSQSVRFTDRAAQVGDRTVRLVRAQGSHFDMLDPTSEAWHLTVHELERLAHG